MKAIKDAERISLAKRLIVAGARLTTVRALTGINPRDSLALYRAILHGDPPRAGAITSKLYYLQSLFHQFHASAFFSFYVRAKAAYPTTVLGELILEAHQFYKQAVVNSYSDLDVIDIDRAFFLIQSVEFGELAFHRCGDCGSHFIAPNHIRPGRCPICAAIKRERCTACGTKMSSFVLFPKESVGRRATKCAECRSKNARKKRTRDFLPSSAPYAAVD